MVWGEARAAEQCVDAGAPEITGKAQALLSGRAANGRSPTCVPTAVTRRRVSLPVDHDRQVEPGYTAPADPGLVFDDDRDKVWEHATAHRTQDL
jgi:hypothetical protein